MKNYRYLLAMLLTFSIAFWACNNDSSNANTDKDTVVVKKEVVTDNQEVAKPDSVTASTEKEALGVEYTAKFVCPNHCKGSGSDKAGECSNSECGMELMENPNYKE